MPTDTQRQRRSMIDFRPMSDDELKEWFDILGLGDSPEHTKIKMTIPQRRFTQALIDWCEMPFPVYAAFVTAAHNGTVGVTQRWIEHWEEYRDRGHKLRHEDTLADG